jgi:hypothetical protein
MKYRFKKADLGVFNTKSASEALKGFSNNCRILGLTRGEFSMIDLIKAVLDKIGSSHVICTT